MTMGVNMGVIMMMVLVVMMIVLCFRLHTCFGLELLHPASMECP
jgi:hypothetical protein